MNDELVLFDEWLYMGGETREALNKEDVWSTEHLCDKTYSELKAIVGCAAAKEIKEELSERQLYLKGSDYGVSLKKRFSVTHT